MKKLFLFTALAFFSLVTSAQLGPDVIVNSTGDDYQRIEMDVAFNGWVYVAASFVTSSGEGGIDIKMSKDKGNTWQQIDRYSVPDTRYRAHDIVVAGTDTNSLVLYLVGVNNQTAINNYVLFVDKYNAKTGVFLGSNFNQSNGTRSVYDVAIASDYFAPSVTALPYSVAFVYSTYSSSYDSVAYVASMDGGASFSIRQNVFTTSMYTRKVCLSYGRSASASNGRYFVAWERVSGTGVRTGNIYTARNASTVNGAFTMPKCLDSLSGTMIGLCRNPRIATQYMSLDNDSGSLTAAIVVDRDYIGDGSDFDVLGFYNKRAHYTNFWYRFDVENSGNSSFSPDISYDPLGNRFVAAYYDSTAAASRIVEKPGNLPTPGSWTQSGSFIDSTVGVARPGIRTTVNISNGKAGFAWNKNKNGNGVTYFDAQFKPVFGNLSESICAGTSFLFNAVPLTTAGTYKDTLTAGFGADSIVTLALTVNPLPTPTISLVGNNSITTQNYASYQWQYNGSNIPGATNQTFVGLSNGVYTVVVTDANGCSGTSAPFTLTNAGIDEAKQQYMGIYPNPASSYIRIVTDYYDANDIYTVTDISGRQVMRISGSEISGNIDVSFLMQGVYIITRNGQAATRFIITR